MQQFAFDRQFQIGILALMVQRYDFLLMGVDLLKPEYFEDKVLSWFFITIRDHHTDYKQSPSVNPVIKNEILKACKAKRIKKEEVDSYLEVYNQLPKPVNSQNYVINEVVRFIRRQEGRAAFLTSAKLMDTADDTTWDTIIDSVAKVGSIGSSYIDVGTFYFKDYKERLNERMNSDIVRKIPTGITELDYKIGGGVKDGQLVVWMGSTGRGKSLALSHCGKIAVIHGYKVLHYTLELSQREIADRYDSSWTQTQITNLISNTNNIELEMDRLYTKYGNSLVIKEFPTGTVTVNALKNHCRQLNSMGFVPDLIIVDYGDLLKPVTSYKDRYDDLGAIFTDLRGWAGELKVPLLSATQSNRAGLSAEIVDLEHMADSLQKAMVSDIVIGICATKEELENNTLRLFGAKNRNGPSGFVIEIQSDYSRMCFFNPSGVPNTVKSDKSVYKKDNNINKLDVEDVNEEELLRDLDD